MSEITESNEWEKFFNAHAPVYMDNSFTRNTIQEVDFILLELKVPLKSCILDIGCGTGRHAIELAKRGYQITGVDISAGMLEEARKAAGKVTVDVTWVQADAVKFATTEKFDAAVCLCEGAFGLLGSGDDPIEHDLNILRNIHSALKARAKLIMTTLNGYRFIRKCSKEDIESGRFNPNTITESIELDSLGGKKGTVVRERGYVPTELILLFRLVGFVVENIWGGTAGNWGHRQLELDEMEVMIIARKGL